MAGGGVEIGVDADHELELGQQAFEAPGVRGRQGRVAGDRQQRSHLPLAGRLHLVGERRDGELAERLRQPAHPAVPPSRLEGPRRPPLLLVGGMREHRAAGPVEIPGQDVEHVDEPGSERPVRGRMGADPAVDHRGRRRCELAGERAHGVGRHAGERRDALGREAGHRRFDELDPRDDIGQCARVGEALGEEHAGDAREQRGVRSGANRHVQVGVLGRPRPARIDDDDPATTPPDRLEPAGPVGCGRQAAVRLERVGAEQQRGGRCGRCRVRGSRAGGRRRGRRRRASASGRRSRPSRRSSFAAP